MFGQHQACLHAGSPQSVVQTAVGDLLEAERRRPAAAQGGRERHFGPEPGRHDGQRVAQQATDQLEGTLGPLHAADPVALSLLIAKAAQDPVGFLGRTGAGEQVPVVAPRAVVDRLVAEGVEAGVVLEVHRPVEARPGL